MAKILATYIKGTANRNRRIPRRILANVENKPNADSESDIIRTNKRISSESEQLLNGPHQTKIHATESKLLQDSQQRIEHTNVTLILL